MTRWGSHVAFSVFALLFAFALGLSALPASAVAAPALAQKQLVEGDRAGQAGKWEEALAAYRKAHAESASGASAIRIANALYKLNRLPDAHDAYQAALAQWSASLLAGDKRVANDRIQEIAGKTGTIAVVVNEAAAGVSVDDKPMGASPLALPIRVASGPHRVRVSKDGFEAFETEVEVLPKGAISIDVELTPVSKVGRVSVTAKGTETIVVLVDGAEVGTAPWEGDLSPGEHKIAGRSATVQAPPVTIEVRAGVPTKVELLPGVGRGTLEIRTEAPKSAISIDGQNVGQGSYKGELDAGDHEMVILLDGFAPFAKKVTVVAGEVVVETITLRKKAAGEVVEPISTQWTFDGLYGGLQLVGMFAPAGSNNTLESSCQVTGATSCASGVPLGGAVAGYIGYAFAPVGLELLLLSSGDLVNASATFDGTTGSEVNPLVAAPAREEAFTIGRFGGGGAARLRMLLPIDRFRVTGALGAGLAYRHMLLGRQTVAQNGAQSSTGNADGDGYLSGVLSVELAAQLLLLGATSFVLGANMWLEHAGDGLSTPAKNDVFLTKKGAVPSPQATPSYNMASGTQVFVGPFVGLHFGP